MADVVGGALFAVTALKTDHIVVAGRAIVILGQGHITSLAGVIISPLGVSRVDRGTQTDLAGVAGIQVFTVFLGQSLGVLTSFQTGLNLLGQGLDSSLSLLQGGSLFLIGHFDGVALFVSGVNSRAEGKLAEHKAVHGICVFLVVSLVVGAVVGQRIHLGLGIIVDIHGLGIALHEPVIGHVGAVIARDIVVQAGVAGRFPAGG